MSLLKNTFTSRENKELVWGLLIENGYFEGLNNSNNMVNFFEKSITNISNQIKGNENIIDLNKNLMSILVEEIKQQKNIINIQFNNKQRQIYTAEDIRERRKNEFQNQLNSRQENFNNTFKKKQPKDIDFSIKTENNNNDIDKKLSEIMERRKMDLDFKKSDIQKANGWINNDNAPPSSDDMGSFVPLRENTNNKIKIGDAIKIDHDIIKKKVTFSEEKNLIYKQANVEKNDMGNAFLNLLKKKEKTGNDNIIMNYENTINELKVDIEKLKNKIKMIENTHK